MHAPAVAISHIYSYTQHYKIINCLESKAIYLKEINIKYVKAFVRLRINLTHSHV